MKCIVCENQMFHLRNDLWLCQDCGLISSDMSADPSIYDKSYIIKYKRYENTEIGYKINDLRYNVIRKHVQANNVKLLDYGCGVGSFINLCNSNNIQANGFDINPYGKYLDVSILFDRYDIVTFWDSIEHLKEPNKIIQGFNPEYLFICTPSTDDFKGDRSELVRWRHYMPTEHVHYFNLNSLSKLLKKNDYKIIEVNYEESKYRAGGGDKNILTIGAIKV